MVRTVWQYQNRPDQSWSGGAAGVTNHQIVQTLEANPGLRDYVAVGDRIAAETEMIKSAAGAAAYLVDQANPRKKTRMADWHEGIAEGAGLDKSDPRLIFRKAMFATARKQAGVAAVPGQPRARSAVSEGVQCVGRSGAAGAAALRSAGARTRDHEGRLTPRSVPSRSSLETAGSRCIADYARTLVT